MLQCKSFFNLKIPQKNKIYKKRFFHHFSHNIPLDACNKKNKMKVIQRFPYDAIKNIELNAYNDVRRGVVEDVADE